MVLERYPRGCGEKSVVNGTQSPTYEGIKSNVQNKSGTVGAYYDDHRKRWRADDTYHHNRRFLGYFCSFEEAVKAREDAVEEFYEPKNKEEIKR